LKNILLPIIMREDLDFVFTQPMACFWQQCELTRYPCLLPATSAELDRVPPHYCVLNYTSREQLLMESQPLNNKDPKDVILTKKFYTKFHYALCKEM
jgi:hypothetical protein